jgi:outer membrane lipoprotein-sorting protein
MEKQKVFFGLGTMLVCSLLLLSGCTQQSESKESIQTILQKANNVGDVYYEIIGTTSTEMGNYSYNYTYTMKVWQKMPYMKTETTTGGITQIIVIRPDGSYMYNNQTQNYTKFLPTYNQTQQKFLEEQANEMLESQTLKELGTATIDGKAATIVEYSYTASGMTISPKLWIWNEKGIPLKMEMKYTIAGFNMTITMEYKNFAFGEIPDSTFNVS